MVNETKLETTTTKRIFIALQRYETAGWTKIFTIDDESIALFNCYQ